MRPSVVVFAIIFFTATTSMAQTGIDTRGGITDPGGSVIPGYDNRACDLSIEGAIRYDSGTKQFEGCNGTNWSGLGGGTLGSLADVVITSPDDGVPLVYDSASGNWVNKTCDDSPNTSFPDLENQALSTLVTSSIRLMEGITCGTVPVSISGQGVPEYRICSDASCSTVTTNWTTATNNISSGEYIQARLTTNAGSDVTHTGNVTMGSVTDAWDVTTIGPKTVFVTSTTYDGNLGGLSGADSYCQDRADAAGLAGTYMAWLSDSTASPSTRFNQSSQQYVLTNGNVIANDWADLTDSTLAYAINRDEFNTAASGTPWTATSGNGTQNGSMCSDWTHDTNMQFGGTGNSGSASSIWTQGADNGCASNNPLYCFEQ